MKACRKNSSPALDALRILVVRTDRIGDVLLSTPVVQVLREAFPKSYIAMMVRPYAREIVEGNPYIDEVIVYDKDSQEHSLWANIRFALSLRKKHFDLALILHPANRVHLLVFFVGIKKRIGYKRKLGFLVNHAIEERKRFGSRHESDYTLDLVRILGVQPRQTQPYMPLKPEAEQWAEELLDRRGWGKDQCIIGIHPGASCPSKRWSTQRFGEVGRHLQEKRGAKLILLAGPQEQERAQEVLWYLDKENTLNLAGKTTVSQLASILRRCRLFIANDSGPVHIAVAVGTPVVVIFGRKQPGLGPVRWGPLGEKSRIIHKDVGCQECLAHLCQRGFACLEAVKAEDVMSAIDGLLGV